MPISRSGSANRLRLSQTITACCAQGICCFSVHAGGAPMWGSISAMAATAIAQARTMGAMESGSTTFTAAISTRWLATTGLNSGAQAESCVAMTDRISLDAVNRFSLALA